MRWIATAVVLCCVGIVRGGEPPKAAGPGEAPPQILLHVKILELDEVKLRRAGFDFSQVQKATGSADTKADAQADERTVVRSSSELKGLVDLLRQGGKACQDLIEALRKDGLVRVLAEPTLVTPLGQLASCRIGGEVPIRDVGPNGQPAIRFEHYGTSVDVVPELASQGKIRLHLRCEFSEPDRDRTVVVEGTEIPAIRKISVESTFEAKPAETVVLSGEPQQVRAEPGGSQRRFIVVLATTEMIPAVAAMPGAGATATRQ